MLTGPGKTADRPRLKNTVRILHATIRTLLILPVARGAGCFLPRHAEIREKIDSFMKEQPAIDLSSGSPIVTSLQQPPSR
jgi:hypothetical protein